MISSGRTIEIMPLAWQYPEIASARMVLDGPEFTTAL